MGVDLQEKRQLDLSEQVARVKARTRPWRSIIALVLAIAAAGISRTAHGDSRSLGIGKTAVHLSSVIAPVAAAAFCVFAAAATVGLSGKARDVLQPRVGTAHAAVVRYAIAVVGSALTLVVTLQLFKIPIGQLVLGGALTGVLLGIAGQQTLANVFAGMVLLLSRPFNVGDKIRLKSGALGGEHQGVVTEIGITYVRLDAGDGIMSLPNSQVLAAAVGPAPPESPAPPERNAQHAPPSAVPEPVPPGQADAPDGTPPLRSL
jgi:small-conductance mechanosensitive channel